MNLLWRKEKANPGGRACCAPFVEYTPAGQVCATWLIMIGLSVTSNHFLVTGCWGSTRFHAQKPLDQGDPAVSLDGQAWEKHSQPFCVATLCVPLGLQALLIYTSPFSHLIFFFTFLLQQAIVICENCSLSLLLFFIWKDDKDVKTEGGGWILFPRIHFPDQHNSKAGQAESRSLELDAAVTHGGQGPTLWSAFTGFPCALAGLEVEQLGLQQVLL